MLSSAFRTYRAENLLSLLENSNFGPFKLLKDSYAGRVVNRG